MAKTERIREPAREIISLHVVAQHVVVRRTLYNAVEPLTIRLLQTLADKTPAVLAMHPQSS